MNKGLRIANDIVVQAWKAMVGGDSFMKAGWFHDMRAHVFSHQNEERILVMGKVNFIVSYIFCVNFLNIIR